MRVKTVLIGLLVFLSVYPLFGQQQKIDSLKRMVNMQEARSLINLNACIGLAQAYANVSADSSLHYAKSALKLATVLNEQPAQLYATFYMAAACINLGKIGRAKSMLHGVLQRAKLRADTTLQQQAMGKLAEAYRKEGVLDSAEVYLNTLVKLAGTGADSAAFIDPLYQKGVVKLMQGKYSLANSYLKRALALASVHANAEKMWDCLNGLGVLHAYISNLDTSLVYFRQLEAITDTADYVNVHVVATNIANIYMQQGNLHDAVQHSIKALLNAKKANDHHGISQGLLQLGNNYSKLHQFKKAEEYYLATEAHASSSNDVERQIQANIGLALVYKTTELIAKAKESIQRAMSMIEAYDMAYLYVDAWQLQGEILFEEGRYNEAEAVFSQSLAECTRQGREDKRVSVLNYLAEIAFRQGAYNEALTHAMRLLRTAKNQHDLAAMVDAYEMLSSTNLKLGNNHEAYANFELYGHYKDSLLNEQNLRSINELQAKYETEKKEQQLKRPDGSLLV